MIEALESRYRVEECSFNTIFGSFHGNRICASRKVGRRSRSKPATLPSFTTWMSGKTRGICLKRICSLAETKMSPENQTFQGIYPVYRSSTIARKGLRGRRRLSLPIFWGSSRSTTRRDPLSYADTLVPLIVKKAKRLGLELTFSRSCWFKSMPPSPIGAMGRSTTRMEQ
jgi:hypothetical protein